MGYHDHMQKIADIDILGDKDLQQRVVWLSLGVLVVTLAVVALLAALGLVEAVDVWWWVALAIGCVAPLGIHELVHGAAFLLLCPGCHVSFGFKDAFLYTKTEGVVATRGRMVAVLLAPTLLVTSGVAALAAALGLPMLAVLLAGMHLSGCAGDALMAAAVLREPRCTHVRDTDTGIELLAEGDQ